MSVETSATKRVRDLSVDEFGSRLRTGLNLQIGPFVAKVCADPISLVNPLYALYQDYRLLTNDNVFSFHVQLNERRNFPRLDNEVVRFMVDGRAPHEDMPAEQALPVLEWGLNLVIALRFHCYLMLHSAVVEIGGKAMLLPAAPGHGKTTLSTGLSLRGWRLLSDEFGLLRPGSTELIPVPRPMALKNQSVDVIRQFEPEAVIGPATPNTRKGTVAHVKPPSRSIIDSDQTAPAKWVVFPRWRPGVPSSLTEVSKAEGFMFLATNAFNYELLGEAAFHTVTGLINQTRCFRFEYSDLDDAVAMLTDFASRDDS